MESLPFLQQGGDEVIACYKTSLLSGQINAATYMNHYLHNRPKKHERHEIVSLVQVPISSIL